ncbi:MAG TPA: hypothetical protein VFG10_06615 [Saprospiraceae bacterium]|nr:hypothetical protein [Saprospiraceae bacterium]
MIKFLHQTIYFPGITNISKSTVPDRDNITSLGAGDLIASVVIPSFLEVIIDTFYISREYH